jgi:hypothetical protein
LREIKYCIEETVIIDNPKPGLVPKGREAVDEIEKKWQSSGATVDLLGEAEMQMDK